jgi:hypothetical protein
MFLPRIQTKVVKTCLQPAVEFFNSSAIAVAPVYCGPGCPLLNSVSGPDPDVWDRIRILALINDQISTFLVCV